jgi:subtilisin family serine protease
MKRGFLSLAIFGLLAAAPAQAQKGPPVDMGMADEMRPVAPSGAVPGQYIIVLNEDVTNVRGVAAEMARDHGLGIQFIYTNALRGFAAQVPEGRLQALERDPRVDYIEQDQWGGIEVHGDSTNGTNPVVGIMRVNADMNANIDIDGADDLRVDVDVAVIDTGIDLAHPDLNVVGGINCASGNKFSVSCSGDGDAGHWHGTHVAGTIAALDDGHDVSLDGGMDVVGVAPGARLWAVRVLDNRGAGTAAQYIAGVDWVIGNGAIEVANSSLGYPHSDAICDAVERLAEAGVTHAVSAGNDESLVFKSPGDCVGIDETTGEAKEVVITVSAIADYNGEPGGGAAPNCDHGDGDLDDSLADFSNSSPPTRTATPGPAAPPCLRPTSPARRRYLWRVA